MGKTSLASDLRWPTEAAMVAEFSAWAVHCGWNVYPETCSWDLLLVRPTDGFQIGVEAKLSLNATVLCQVLSRQSRYDRGAGPDCRAILAPRPKTVNGLETIARHLGIVVVTGSAYARYRTRPRNWTGPEFTPGLPEISRRHSDTTDEMSAWGGWPEMCPDVRHALPEYVPDVTGGHPAPLQLTPWKIQAIKAAVVIEIVGYLTRADLKALKLDPSRWTQFWLEPRAEKRWAPGDRRHPPNFKAQHPTNYAQIKADVAVWGAGVPSLSPAP